MRGWEFGMSDKKDEAKTPVEEKPHKVDEAAQEEAGRERSETEGYE